MSINLNEISALILALVSTPAVAAIISTVCSYLKNRSTINKEIKEPINTLVTTLKEENAMLKEELIAEKQEKRALMKKMNELLTKIDRIDRTNEEI